MNHILNRPSRRAGLLLPISSLPKTDGCGSLGAPFRECVDHLLTAGFESWSILPIHPTGYGNSPYQPISCFAGNPYFISVDQLVEEELLTAEDLAQFKCHAAPECADYGFLYETRFQLLRKAFNRFLEKNLDVSINFKVFCHAESDWLPDYMYFMTCKELHRGAPWWSWPDAEKHRKGLEWKKFQLDHAQDTLFWAFVQFEFFKQWHQCKRYALAHDVEIIGDLPMYPAADSVDVWVHKDLFRIDPETGAVLVSAGAPASDRNNFIRNWGNPLYNWETASEEGYQWFQQRVWHECRLFDCLRIDHVQALWSSYGIPLGESTGKFYPGPDQLPRKLSNIIQAEALAAGVEIIAEDLGAVSPEVLEMMQRHDWAGMRLQQYAYENYGPDNRNLSFYYEPNMVAYTGTHDNIPLKAYISSKSPQELLYMKQQTQCSDQELLPMYLINKCYNSCANRMILPMQDVLGLGAEASMTDPVHYENSWCWRLSSWYLLTPKLTEEFKRLAVCSGRFHVDPHTFSRYLFSIR